jgi:pSer/pThr/pTyr-binding forkhead associated (FHA) protein
VRDLGSSNGTFVNGQRITQAELYPGDTVRFDVLSFSIEGPGQVRPANSRSTDKQHSSQSEAENTKRWKTKPTSVGNRHDTLHIPIAKKAVNKLALAALAILTLATVASVAYLITLL